MKRIFQIIAVCAGLMTQACGNKADLEQNVAPAAGARVKFYHLAPDVTGLNIFANDVKISGVNTVSPFPPATQTTPNLLTYGGSFPNLDYAALAAGSLKIKAVVPASGTTTETVVASAEQAFDDGKYYSIYAYGAAPNYGTLVLNDDFTAADPTKAYVRFVNLVNPGTAAASPAYDLTVNGAALFSGVAFKGNTSTFTAITPIAYGGTKVPVVAKTGATSVASGSAFSLQPYAGKFYTIIVSGIVGGTGAKAPTLYVSTNR